MFFMGNSERVPGEPETGVALLKSGESLREKGSSFHSDRERILQVSRVLDITNSEAVIKSLFDPSFDPIRRTRLVMVTKESGTKRPILGYNRDPDSKTVHSNTVYFFDPKDKKIKSITLHDLLSSSGAVTFEELEADSFEYQKRYQSSQEFVPVQALRRGDIITAETTSDSLYQLTILENREGRVFVSIDGPPDSPISKFVEKNPDKNRFPLNQLLIRVGEPLHLHGETKTAPIKFFSISKQ